MSTQDSAAWQALLAQASAQPWSHDFFALVRRLDALRPELPRTGHALRPSQETLRFAQPPELDFAAAPLHGLQLRWPAAPRLSVRFFGLLGPHGPMPLHLTEYVRERSHHEGDSATQHFLDLFHHRMLALFYRAWAQGQAVVQADRPDDDRFQTWLNAIAGQRALPRAAMSPARSQAPAAVPTPAASGQASRPSGLQAPSMPTEQALAYHASLLAGRSRHAEALCKVLRAQLGVPVAVVPHIGHWLAIEPQDHSRLGHARNRAERLAISTGQVAAQLGRTANAGNRVWDRQYRFRLQLGPMPLTHYHALLPGALAWPALKAWVQRLAGPALHWDLQLQLADGQHPRPCLGRDTHPSRRVASAIGKSASAGADSGAGPPEASTRRPRLGVDCWLGGWKPSPDGGVAAQATAMTTVTARRSAVPRLLRLRPDTSFLQRRAAIPGMPTVAAATAPTGA